MATTCKKKERNLSGYLVYSVNDGNAGIVSVYVKRKNDIVH